MNRIIMSLIFIFFCAIAVSAQSSANTRNSNVPVITKGYYSIYKNADKLNHSDHLVSIETSLSETAVIQPRKGYYSLGNHHRKIYKSGVSFIAKTPSRPVAAKGYYNINTQTYNVAKGDKNTPLQTDSMYAVAE